MNRIFYRVIIFLFLSTGIFGQDTEIFLKAIEAEFQVVDMDQDDDGNTYLLGRSGADSVVKKFNATGLVVEEQEIENLSPAAFHVASNGYIYVASSNQVRRLSTEDLSLDAPIFDIPAAYTDLTFRDIVFVSSTNKLVIGAQNPGSRWPRMIQTEADLTSGPAATVIAITEVGYQNSGGATVQSVAVDDQGNAYMVGESSGAPAAGYVANRGYIAKLATNGSHIVRQPSGYNDLFEVSYRNGWVYVLGIVSSTDDVKISRLDSTLGGIDKAFVISNPNYAGLGNDVDTNKRKFSLAADALDNLYVTGYPSVEQRSFTREMA